MKDIVAKKRIKIDYKDLIKGSGLWSTYWIWSKNYPKLKSHKRKMYCFCMKFLKNKLLEIKKFQKDVQENIRLANDHSWIEEDI